MNKLFMKHLLLGIPKSIYANFRLLPIGQAIKLPILVSNKTKFISCKGGVELADPPKVGMLRIGLYGSGSASCLPVRIELNGVLRVEHGVKIGGCSLTTIDEKSRMSIGRDTVIMGETRVMSSRSIRIGRGCMISWGVQIMDTDWHSLLKEGRVLNTDEEVSIGDGSWICSNVTVLKGAQVPEGTVIASGSTIAKSWDEQKCVVTGMPFKIIKEDVCWKKDRPLRD